jgi:hypothetical protein
MAGPNSESLNVSASEYAAIFISVLLRRAV